MRCPKCNHNQLRGKDGMSCQNCRRMFIFDPKKHNNGSKSITDAYFIKCIDKLSQNNTYHFTEDELYCFMATQTKHSLIGCLLGTLFITAFSTIVLQIIFDWGFYPALFIFPILLFLAVRSCRKTLSKKKWNKYLKHWNKLSKKYNYEDTTLAGMITSRQLLEKPQQPSEPDIYDYGAAKLLICEHDRQVDWLVLNKFHAENGIVIISENFYPTYLKEQVQKLIETNPELKIHTLHNAGQTGEQMISRLRNPLNDWKLGGHEIVDLGVSLEHLAKTKINSKIIAQYNSNFPAHGITYHQFHPMLNHCLLHGVAFATSYTAIHNHSDSGFLCDFG